MTSIFLVRIFQKLPKQTRGIVQTCLYGLLAGAAAVVFQSGMNWVYRLGLVRLSHQSFATFLVGSLVSIVLSSLTVAGC